MIARVSIVYLKILILGFFLLLQFPSYSQKKDEKTDGTKTKNYKSFKSEKWLQLRKGLNYSDDKPDAEPERKDDPKFSSPIKINSDAIKIALFVLASAALIFILIKLFQQPYDRDLEISENKYSLENIDESVHEADLESFLQKARDSGDHRQVIRIYYLIILRELSSKKMIFWKKDKTNAEYLKEMKDKDSFKLFRELTFLFEWVWFGNKLINEKQYEILSNNFERYINQLKALKI
jgi:hypothetical protein